MKKLFLTALSFLFLMNSEAQILGRILDRTADKLSDKIEDKLVEKISEEIARAAFRPIDDAVNEMFRERYRQDSINGKTDVDYGEFLNSFTQSVDLPASYNFDIAMLCETKDYDGEKHKMEMLLRNDGQAIGIVQLDEGNNSMMVFDLENQLMAIYSEEDGEKKVVAMPSMLSLAKAFAEADGEEYEMTVEKTGKTKKIMSYQTQMWNVEDEETTSKVYVAPDFPTKWNDAFGPFIQKVSPVSRRDEMPNGMVLKSETKTKKKNKKSTFEVKKINEAGLAIDNSEYTKQDFSGKE